MNEPWSVQPYHILHRRALELGIEFGGRCTGNYIEGRHVWLYTVEVEHGQEVRRVVANIPPVDLADYVGSQDRQALLCLPFDPTHRGPRGDVTPPERRAPPQVAVA